MYEKMHDRLNEIIKKWWKSRFTGLMPLQMEKSNSSKNSLKNEETWKNRIKKSNEGLGENLT